jgi:crotonobetainyl-CoA:carnitine CoA-transferase CaiB-like acyl-CoA transferase
MKAAEPQAAQPLQGLRVLSVETYAAGPHGSQLLAALGAEVVKIENPATGGDPARYVGPHRLGPADSQYYQGWNANKRSVALDLKSDDGRRDFEALVKTAGAVMNNLRGDQPAELGLDYAALGQLKPSIVCLHISAYGRDNERAGWPGYDFLMQAETGLMSLTGEPGGPPARFGASIIDYMTGTTAMVGLLASLIGAERSGRGCDVDVSLYDVALQQLCYAGNWYLNAGEELSRLERSSHLALAPVQTFPTADGWIFLMCMNEKFWRLLIEALELEPLASDPRFVDVHARHRHRRELTALLDPVFGKATTAEWLAKLSGILPIGPVHDVAEALSSPFAQACGMIQPMPHPEKHDLKLLGSPIKINGERPGLAPCSPLGADTQELLDEAHSRRAVPSSDAPAASGPGSK